MDLLRSHGLLGSSGEIMVPAEVPANGPPQRVHLASALPVQGSPTPGNRQAVRVRSQASQNALVSLATSTAPPAPPGAYQASLRDGSGFPHGARNQRGGLGLRDNALPDVPQPDTSRLLSDSLLDFQGPQPDFGDDDGKDSARSAQVSPRPAACAGGAYVGCGCNCRCRGDAFNVLTGPGGRFAFYTCRRMHGGGAEQSAVDEDDDNKKDIDSTEAAALIAVPNGSRKSSALKVPVFQTIKVQATVAVPIRVRKTLDLEAPVFQTIKVQATVAVPIRVRKTLDLEAPVFQTIKVQATVAVPIRVRKTLDLEAPVFQTIKVQATVAVPIR
ncbi:hypothetical protein N0V82_010400, partial [Gnomoniopsis sp. IMI 355080]